MFYWGRLGGAMVPARAWKGALLRWLYLPLALFVAVLMPARAAAASALPASDKATPGIEIVRQHVDIDVLPNATYSRLDDVAYRVLTEQGRAGSQQITLSYTEGFQSIDVRAAYTLKANGKRIDVDSNSILFGHGASSQPGYQDTRNVTVVFPDLEIGDQVVLVTLFRQTKPWFDGRFGFSMYFANGVVNDDARITLTAPANDFPLLVDATGVDGGARASSGGRKMWMWSFHNDTAKKPESYAVLELSKTAHVSVSSFASYADAAKVYAARMEGKARVTPEIQTLADTLTKGISNRQEKAHVLYDWVASHISYVALVLGAGGFVPNAAGDVLATKYGDCKDHVMLLEAMLKAEGIDSTPVLIDVGSLFELPLAASPFNFNHMITYIPAFGMFTDSTARYAPFGVLPDSDQGKPVVLVDTGAVVTTPRSSADTNTLRIVQTLEVHADGSAEGQTETTATGNAAITMRALLSAVPPGRDGDFFRAILGPGANGSIDRGDIERLTPEYAFKAHFTIANYINLPGPGALPVSPGFSPLSFPAIIGGDLPAHRTQGFACESMSAQSDVTMSLPENMKIVSLPKAIDEEAGGIHLQTTHETLSGNRLHEHTELRAVHDSEVCDAQTYNGARDALMKMINGLRAQALYQ